MLSKDCKALDRFKRQRLALKRGRVSKETGHSTTDPIKDVVFSEEQYMICRDKLCVGATEEELLLFDSLNKRR